MIKIRYTFDESDNEYVATLYLDGEAIETRRFGYRDQLNHWARAEGCSDIAKEPAAAA